MQLGQIMDKRNKNTKKPLMALLKSQEWVWKGKVGSRSRPLRSVGERSGQRSGATPPARLPDMACPHSLQVSSKLTHPRERAGKEPVVRSHSPLLQQEPPWSLAWKNNDTLYLTDCTKTDYILCCQRRGSSIRSGKTRRGAHWGSDQELLSAKSRLNWRK